MFREKPFHLCLNNEALSLRHTVILYPFPNPWGWPNVITVFLRSLVRHSHGKLIAIIVSGYDSDGAAALCEIRAVGDHDCQKSGTADVAYRVSSLPSQVTPPPRVDGHYRSHLLHLTLPQIILSYFHHLIRNR